MLFVQAARLASDSRQALDPWRPSCLQIAAAAMSVGPHRAIRHPDLQLFWWRHMEGAEEVEWAAMWPALSAFLARATCLSDRAGDVQAIQEMLNVSSLHVRTFFNDMQRSVKLPCTCARSSR